MIVTEIKESEWKSFDEIDVEPETPYWFKMENGNVVLAVHINTGNCSGWAKAFFDDKLNLKYRTNTFYMLKGAKLQPASLNIKSCSICNGTGEVQQSDVDWDECRRCNGTGKE